MSGKKKEKEKQERHRERLQRKGRSHDRLLETKERGFPHMTHYTRYIPVERRSLSPELLEKIREVWRYFDYPGAEPVPALTLDQWVMRLETDFLPELNVFYWQTLAIASFDMIRVGALHPCTSEIWAEGKDLATFLDGFSSNDEEMSSPCLPDAHLLAFPEHLRLWKILAPPLRSAMYLSLHVVASKGPGWGGLEELVVRQAIAALIRTSAGRHAEFKQLLDLKHERYGMYLGAVCAQCLQMSTDCKMCARCKMTYYCNTECQKKHWGLHKSECGRVDNTLVADVGPEDEDKGELIAITKATERYIAKYSSVVFPAPIMGSDQYIKDVDPSAWALPS